MNKTKIEYADYTWNPITGCTPISAGCAHCYAAAIAKRFWDRPFSQVEYDEHRLDEPKSVLGNQVILTCSMGDMFHEATCETDYSILRDIFRSMAACAQHSFLVLTKRIERADDFMQYYACPNNVWIGTTVESQHNVRRMEILLAIDATRWLSCEPLLSELILPDTRDREIAFVACAEESGPGARPAKIEWFHKLRDWCRINGTHFFYKGKAFPELRRYNSLPYTLGTKCCERSANG